MDYNLDVVIENKTIDVVQENTTLEIALGQKGDQGEQGIQGIQGPVGPKGDTGLTGPAGADGATGKSAYQHALDNGFVGTEAAWLASLEGPQGIQGEQGIQGPQGLTGPQGEMGPQGLTGNTGPQGPQGIQGETGPAGAGVATGGTAGQVLAKIDATNYNTQWIDPPAGGFIGSTGNGYGLPGRLIYGRNDTTFTANQLWLVYFEVHMPIRITGISHDIFGLLGTDGGSLHTAIYNAVSRLEVGTLHTALPSTVNVAQANYTHTADVTLQPGGYWLVSNVEFGNRTQIRSRNRLWFADILNNSGIQTRTTLSGSLTWSGSWPSTLTITTTTNTNLGGPAYDSHPVTVKWEGA